MKKLLLISNSTNYGETFLEHCAEKMVSFLSPITELTFIPYADADWDGYYELVRAALTPLGITVRALHQGQPLQQLENAQAVFVGGGNTFRLLKTLQQLQLLEPLRAKVLAGMPYIGSSAGSNIVAPTIKTTNDMPIVEPAGFAALDLVPFQINPHYVDPSASTTHMGETREQRIREYFEENDIPVIGLREGSWLEVADSKVVLGGKGQAKLFLVKNAGAEVATKEVTAGAIVLPK